MKIGVTVHGQAFSELKMPYDIVVAADFADLECEASAKSVAVCATREQHNKLDGQAYCERDVKS